MLGTATILVDIGRSLREGFFMFWETLWPLVLGFGLAGAVQAFVSRDAMRQRLGNHGPRAVIRASGYGMASSSCSYAASAMAKSLFVKGADYIAAMVFMFASTNLVIELGIVLVVLMGWQFAVSEFVGGIIMIVLLATVGALWLRGRLVVQARERLQGAEDAHEHQHGLSAGGEAGQPPLQDPSAVGGRLGGQRDVHHVRPDHAAPGIGHRLHRRRFLGRAGPDVGLAGGVHQRTRVLDQHRERHRRAVHRHHQLRLLHRQRARWPRRCGRGGSPSGA